jgi:hemerythrin superfamily protein
MILIIQHFQEYFDIQIDQTEEIFSFDVVNHVKISDFRVFQFEKN